MKGTVAWLWRMIRCRVWMIRGRSIIQLTTWTMWMSSSPRRITITPPMIDKNMKMKKIIGLSTIQTRNRKLHINTMRTINNAKININLTNHSIMIKCPLQLTKRSQFMTLALNYIHHPRKWNIGHKKTGVTTVKLPVSQKYKNQAPLYNRKRTGLNIEVRNSKDRRS